MQFNRLHKNGNYFYNSVEIGLDNGAHYTTKDKPNKLSREAEEWIRSFLTSLSNSDTGGYITGKQLQTIVMTKFSTKCCLRTIYNTLHRLNFSWISSRSKHPKSDLEVQELYKKFCAIANRTDTTTC